MRITGQEQEIRKDRMLRAAYSLFCENGIDNVPLARVAEAAGVSPNSIFRYFDNKALLLQQTQEILWGEIVSFISTGNQQSVDDAENGLEEVRILLSGFENLYRNYGRYVLFAYEYKAYMIRNSISLKRSELDENIGQLKELFTYSLERGQKDGSVTTKNTPEELFMFMWGIMRHFVEQLVVYGKIYEGENPLEEMLPLITGCILKGLENDPL